MSDTQGWVWFIEHDCKVVSLEGEPTERMGLAKVWLSLNASARDLARNMRYLALDTKIIPFETAAERIAAKRLMVPFRVDIRKVRTSIFKTRKDDEIAWIGRVVVNGFLHEDDPFFDPKDAMESALADAARRRKDASIGQPTLQPHPWKRPDGTLIKADWEE